MQLDYLTFLQENLQDDLDYDRFWHTISVAMTAASLAMRYHFDSPDRAQIAGLLHDCAKCIDNEEKMALCSQYDIILNEYEQKNYGLIHAKLGAEIASDKYGVLDREILDAIRTHTTGAPNMTMLQKIIYVADYIEPNRDDIIPHIESIQTLAFTDIDEAVAVISKNTLDYLESKGKEIDPATRATYYFYSKLSEKKKKEKM